MPKLPGPAVAQVTLAIVLAACVFEPPSLVGQPELGTAYRYELYTQCGLDTVPIVFDGSEWRVEGDVGDRNPPPGFDAAVDRGHITLETANRGIYVSSHGEERTIVRIRPYVPPPSDYIVPCI